MAFSPLSSPKKSSTHSSSKLKQKRALDFKKKMKLFSKKPTKPLSKDKEVNVLYPKDVEETTMKFVKCNKQKVDSTSHPCGSVNENALALTRVNEVQEKLGTNFPSFVKYMLRSHVTGGFWLGLPRSFCLHNLPKQDETVILVGENGEEHQTKYLANKNGLSGGWRGFSIAHNLIEGDVLVFQLMEEWKFKVFIVRASSLTEIDGAIGLLDLHIEAKPIGFVEEKAICEALTQEYSQFMNESREDFKDVKSFKAFSIRVDGLTVDSEVPEHVRRKYYELCLSQKCYLHKHLIAGLNFQLVAGMILETVNVADAIRAAKFDTPFESLETFDKTLRPFEELGMEVGFLRERLKKLVNISQEQKKKLEEKTHERTALEEEMMSLKLKVLASERAMGSLDAEMEALKVEGSKLELTYKETASAPW